MIIRNATFKGDHDRILAISQEHPDLNKFRDRRIFSPDEAYDSGWIRVAETDYGEVVGFTCARRLIRKPQTSLYFIGITTKWRNKGVGTKLMNDLEKRSNHEWSDKSIRLKVTPTNHNAVDFFLHRGYKFEKDKVHMVKEQPW